MTTDLVLNLTNQQMKVLHAALGLMDDEQNSRAILGDEFEHLDEIEDDDKREEALLELLNEIDPLLEATSGVVTVGA